MTTTEVRLRNDERMVIRRELPPLGDDADQVGAWAAIREDLVNGVLRPWLHTPFFIGEIGDEVAGSMAYYTPADTHDVGVVEFVRTSESQRGRGVATALSEAMLQDFDGTGGLALYLCTTNPIAGRLYERTGFRYRVGDGMRRLSPGSADFDTTYLAAAGSATVRDAHWGDLPRAAVLYNHPEPAWLLKDPLTDTYRDTRYERHFVRLMRQVEDDRGAVLALENPRQRLVGLAAFVRRDTYHAQHVATLGFRVHPAYVSQAPELLDAAVRRARDIDVGVLEIPVADVDRDQARLVERAGFAEVARLGGRIRDGTRWRDLVLYARQVSDRPRAARPPEAFYANRHPWQAERAAELGDP